MVNSLHESLTGLQAAPHARPQDQSGGFLMRVVVAAALCALTAGQAGAAQFYYVSSPFIESNYPTATPPVMTVGMIDIDESKVPGGLANGEIRINMYRDGSQDRRDYSWSEINPAVTSLQFSNGIQGFDRLKTESSADITFRFDADGELNYTDGYVGVFNGEGLSDDLYVQSYDRDFGGAMERWEGPNATGSQASSAYRDTSSLWTTDFGTFVARVGEVVAEAFKRPPSNSCRVAASRVEGDYAIPV